MPGIQLWLLNKWMRSTLAYTRLVANSHLFFYYFYHDFILETLILLGDRVKQTLPWAVALLFTLKKKKNLEFQSEKGENVKFPKTDFLKINWHNDQFT